MWIISKVHAAAVIPFMMACLITGLVLGQNEADVDDDYKVLAF